VKTPDGTPFLQPKKMKKKTLEIEVSVFGPLISPSEEDKVGFYS